MYIKPENLNCQEQFCFVRYPISLQKSMFLFWIQAFKHEVALSMNDVDDVEIILIGEKSEF